MDHPRWQELEPGCRAGPATSDKLHRSPAWSQGLLLSQPGRGTALPGSARLVLRSALLDLPSRRRERPVFIPAPEEAACATALAGKHSWGFPSTAPRHPPTPVPHPLQGQWVPVATMAVPTSLSPSPALPPERWGSIPVRLGVAGMERTGSGYFRYKPGCYFHAESCLQLLPRTDERQLCSPPARCPTLAAGHRTG